VRSGEDVEQFFDWTVGLNPVLAERMRGATRLREFRMDGNYSYAMERFAGDGWLLVGDAAFFVDPIFSSGVGDALHAAKFAAGAIVAALASGGCGHASFRGYEQRLRHGLSVWQEFVRLFYENATVFSRVLADSAHRAHVLRVCEGAVYDEAALQAVARLCLAFEDIRGDAAHPLRRYLAEAVGS
jgi:2-polyprenyl-6-methoxyphenol hydroxylase-like FAD-dependent oxidoreductase